MPKRILQDFDKQRIAAPISYDESGNKPFNTNDHYTRNPKEIKDVLTTDSPSDGTCVDDNNPVESVSEQRIKHYIDKIDTIERGTRNDTLYNKGIRLRSMFGLTDESLESALLEVNQAKCNPPLSEKEVIQIFKSVDKANISVETTSTARKFRGKATPKYRTVHVVAPCTVSVPVADLLLKSVSYYYPNFLETKPCKITTIGQFLDDCKNGLYREQIDIVRAEPDKDKRDELKKGLPCISPHCNAAEGKTIELCEKAGRNGTVTLDFDDIPENEQESAMARIAAIPYVYAVSRSASGRGIVGFAAYEGTSDWDVLRTAMQPDFPDYDIDKKCKGINRLRFATVDENLIVKDEVFPAVLVERVVEDIESKLGDAKSVSPKKNAIIPRLIDMSTVEIKPTEWLWHNRILYSGITVIAGLPKQGKTMLITYVAAVVSKGLNWCDGTPCERGSVLFFAGEDSPEEYARRLKANGADTTKIRILEGATLCPDDNSEAMEIGITLARLDVLEAAINETEKATGLPVRMVVIDPISNFWGDIKENNNAEVRSVLHPFQQFFQKRKIAPVLVQHLRKASENQAQQRVMGSTGIVGIARNLWGVYPDPQNSATKQSEKTRFFAPINSNVCIDPTAISFQILPPDGKVESIEWNLEKTGDDFEVECKHAKTTKPLEVSIEDKIIMKIKCRDISTAPKGLCLRDLQRRFSMYGEGSAEKLDEILREMVKSNRLTRDTQRGSHGHTVTLYCIPSDTPAPIFDIADEASNQCVRNGVSVSPGPSDTSDTDTILGSTGTSDQKLQMVSEEVSDTLPKNTDKNGVSVSDVSQGEGISDTIFCVDAAKKSEVSADLSPASILPANDTELAEMIRSSGQDGYAATNFWIYFDGDHEKGCAFLDANGFAQREHCGKYVIGKRGSISRTPWVVGIERKMQKRGN